MPRLLIVHHTPSPALDAMYRSVHEGATTDELEGVEVVSRAALSANATDVLAADGYVVGTPANLGYMSGALKHFFDLIYYPCLHDTPNRPVGVYVHGNEDTDGALLAISKVVTGLGWRTVHEPVQVRAAPGAEDLEACWDLGATVAANLAEQS